jgi:hypothetical protein
VAEIGKLSGTSTDTTEPSRKLTPKALPLNEAMVPRQLMFWAHTLLARLHKISAQKRLRRVFKVGFWLKDMDSV